MNGLDVSGPFFTNTVNNEEVITSTIVISFNTRASKADTDPFIPPMMVTPLDDIEDEEESCDHVGVASEGLPCSVKDLHVLCTSNGLKPACTAVAPPVAARLRSRSDFEIVYKAPNEPLNPTKGSMPGSRRAGSPARHSRSRALSDYKFENCIKTSL